MKYYLPLALCATMFFAGCIAIPTLNPEYEALATQVGRYICLAEEAGTIQGVEDLSPDRINSIIAQYQGTDTSDTLLTPNEIRTQISEVTQDPVQFGLFLQAMASQQNNCSGNTNAAN